MSVHPAAVLVVDDEPAICELIGTMLSARGYRCLLALDSARAMQLIDREPFSAMIIDVCMPRMSGLDLLDHVRRVSPHCSVILISGAATPPLLADALRLGAYDYITKPFDIDKLAGTVDRALFQRPPAAHLPQRAAKAMSLQLQSRQAALGSVRALVDAVEAKDPYTRRHSEHVAHYALRLAVHLGLDRKQTDSIRVAAMLHDIGKIGVPDRILTKPGPLTDGEFGHIRRHPVLGSEILANITALADESALVRHHHEMWNGKGYPDGLKGEGIPLGARIINVADSIDAMLMLRTYKPPLPLSKVLSELDDGAGAQFDPELSAAAIRWCGEHRQEIIRPLQAA